MLLAWWDEGHSNWNNCLVCKQFEHDCLDFTQMQDLLHCTCTLVTIFQHVSFVHAWCDKLNTNNQSRPAFAKALSSALRCVISENTEEAWLKLFMLPKCVLPSTKRGGRHEKLQPIDFLCNLWANNDLTCLWNLAKGRANELRDGSAKNQNSQSKPVDMAVSFGRCGMLGTVALRLTMMQPGSY